MFRALWDKLFTAFCFLRTVIFIAGLWVSVVYTIPFAIVGYFLPYKIRCPLLLTQWSFIVRFWMWLTCGVKMNVINKENNLKTPCVFLCKHSSTWETFILPTLIRCPSIVLKKQLLSIPVFGWSLASCEPIVIDRSKRKQSMDMILRQGKASLKNGRQILIFPEGTRSGCGEYRKGGAVLAQEAGVSIVPVAHTANVVWPKNRFVIKPGMVHVIFGEAIQPDSGSPEEMTEKTKQWIEEQIKRYSSL